MSGASPDLTLAILTYDRPEGLAATLRSCLGQRNRLGLSIEIVVVDNHPSGSGRPVVEATAAGSPWGRPPLPLRGGDAGGVASAVMNELQRVNAAGGGDRRERRLGAGAQPLPSRLSVAKTWLASNQLRRDALHHTPVDAMGKTAEAGSAASASRSA